MARITRFVQYNLVGTDSPKRETVKSGSEDEMRDYFNKLRKRVLQSNRLALRHDSKNFFGARDDVKTIFFKFHKN